MKPETRKVQRLGLSSLGISLPKQWIKNLGVEAGATVVVRQEDDGVLRISVGMAEPKPPLGECIVDADNCQGEGFLERLITSSYLVGSNTIRVKARGELTPDQVEEVQRALVKLTGVTPVDQGSRYLTLENFAEPSKFPVEGLLRRLQFLTSRMQNLAFGMVVEGGNKREQARATAEEVDRLYTFTVRQLLLAVRDLSVAKQIGVGDPRHVVGDRVFALLLRNMAESYVEIADSGIPLGFGAFPRGLPSAKRFKSLWQEFNDLTDITMGAFFGRDLRRANDALGRVDRLHGTLQTLALEVAAPREVEGPAFCTTCLLLQSVVRPLRGVLRTYASIAQLAMNRALEEAFQPTEAKGEEGASVPLAVP